LARPVEVVVLGRPHLVLTHVGGDDGPGGDLLNGLKHLVGGQFLRVPLQWDLLVGEDPLLPFGVVVSGELFIKKLQHPPGVTDDVMVGLHILVNLRPVNVDLNNLCIVGKAPGVGSDPVGEPAADGDEQVALVTG